MCLARAATPTRPSTTVLRTGEYADGSGNVQTDVLLSPAARAQGKTLPPAPTRNMQVKQDIVTDVVDLQRPAPPRVDPPAPTPPPTPPAPQEPEPKMRTINRTVKPGTTVRGQQRTQSAAPSRRRRTSARMGRRAGTSSLRIARNPNTGSGNLNY